MTEQTIQGRTVAFLVAAEGIEQVELTEPWKAVERAGGTPRLLSPESGKVQAFNHLDRADAFGVDETVADAEPGVVRRAGAARRGRQPRRAAHRPAGDGLRQGLRGLRQAGRGDLHAAGSLVEAGVLDGRTVTSWPSLQTDIRNAGGTWVDEEVVVDGNLVTSRRPDDLPAFNARLLEAIAAG
jgi:protease I